MKGTMRKLIAVGCILALATIAKAENVDVYYHPTPQTPIEAFGQGFERGFNNGPNQMMQFHQMRMMQMQMEQMERQRLYDEEQRRLRSAGTQPLTREQCLAGSQKEMLQKIVDQGFFADFVRNCKGYF